MNSWPRFAVWPYYPLSKAMAFMLEAGIYIRAHVVVIGPLFFAVGWKEPKP